MGPDAMILVFWMLIFKPTFSLSSFTLIKRLFSSSSPFLSSAALFSYCLQCFLASRSFPMCWLLASDDQSMRASASYSNEFSGFISSRIDWFYLFGVQGTLKSLLQYHSSKTSILWHSAFFLIQLSHLYITTGKKNIVLTMWAFVSIVMCLLFNMLSRLVITFLPRSKRLLISWLQSPSALILEPQKIKSLTVSIVTPLFAMKWWDWMPWS